MAKQEITRRQLLKATGGRPHDEEFHFASGAVVVWKIGGKIYEEHQPDIPTKDEPIRRFVH